MRRVRTPTVDADPIPLSRAAAHHLTSVLRLRDGTQVVAFDGNGREVHGVLVIDATSAVIRPTSPIRVLPPAHPVHVVLAIARGPAMDEAVRVATECGATDLHFVRLRRSPPTGERFERWQRKAAAAAEQCGRATVPALHPVRPLIQVVRMLEVPVWFGQPAAQTPPDPGPAALVIGPEGGLTDDEVTALLASGAKPCRLAPHVLRVATAVAVGTAMLSLSSRGRET